jgi:mannose-6-phosphate isomerase
VQPIVRLFGAIQSYEWGSRTALAELLGAASPSADPQAELWLGAHPRGEAEVETPAGAREPLGAWIERDREGVLGAGVAHRFAGRLPFLFKLLAVERALSLQAHPDAAQARAGFEREERAGVADRLYADSEAKPELVVAHTRFTALAGFRPIAAIRAALERVGLGALLLPGESDLRALVARWLAPAADAARDAALARALAAARDDDPAEACMRRLADDYPGDPGVLAPLLLHRIELAPGEGLFLGAGELHCYLGGVAAEIMAASDNVLRAGLTRKPRAIDELLHIGRFEPRTPEILRAVERAPGLRSWQTPAASFELGAIEVGSGGVAVATRIGVEILLCHAGEVRVAGGPTLRRGESCLVPAGAGPYRLEGAGRLYRASVPAAPVGAQTVR